MKFNNLYFKPYKDIFNYYLEIQKINRGFRLYINQINNKISIVNIYKNFEICYEFNNISEINLNNLRFCKIENFQKIIHFLEDTNNNLEHKNNEKQLEVINFTTKEFIKISNRSQKINSIDINKIIGVTKC